MIILDTNVLSALMSDPPEAEVLAWMNRQIASTIWTTSVTILEIQFGLGIMPSGKRRTLLIERFERTLEEMGRRIAVLDEAAARVTAELMASRHKRGKVGELRDSMIAGIVLSHHALLATRNTSHFDDISATVINPWSP
ncbi:MAG TPA: type II toxin-antitoxin system VapC family toxin [Terriglobales bacterium]|nr:type II toxin-antitoxin system VapC family toxin [Terriglobales bacterium]